jgi:hypothetical protein
LLWLTVVVVLAVGWWLDRSALLKDNLKISAERDKAELDYEGFSHEFMAAVKAAEHEAAEKAKLSPTGK